MDFPAWLGNNTAPSDNVIVQMDLGEGREFEMLQSLLLSDRLTLIDHLFVQWHYQAKVIPPPPPLCVKVSTAGHLSLLVSETVCAQASVFVLLLPTRQAAITVL